MLFTFDVEKLTKKLWFCSQYLQIDPSQITQKGEIIEGERERE